MEAEIDVASLSTGVKKRDDHVLSQEMLDAGRFPTMTFRSTRVERKSDDSLAVHGDLTVHGVTRPVVLATSHFGPVKSPFGGEITLGFSATTTVNREDFGVLWGSEALEGGGFIAGKEVEITIRPIILRLTQIPPIPGSLSSTHPDIDHDGILTAAIISHAGDRV